MNMRPLSQEQHNVNLWKVPLTMSLGAICLFALTMTPDVLDARHVIHLPTWLTMGGIDDARAILSAMLSCVSTVLALIFSVALLVVSMVASLFGPRLLYRFLQDWVTQVCIGLFMSAFIYVFLVFLVTHQDPHTTFIPQVSLLCSWVVVLAAFGFLVFYSHRVATLIQNPDAIGRIVDDIRRGIRRYNVSGGEALGFEETHLEQPWPFEADVDRVQSGQSGYVQQIDQKALVREAARAGAVIWFSFRPGQFILEGETLATVVPPSALASLDPLIRRYTRIGKHRVLAQDLEFGLAQIVEIGIRALSPAVNDTFTAVSCVDLLGEALTALALAPQWAGRCFDGDGMVRVHIPPVLLGRLVKQAFDQIRQASASNPAVQIRMISIIGRISPHFHREGDRRALAEQVQAVWENAELSTTAQMDRADIAEAREKTLGIMDRYLQPVDLLAG